MFKVGGLTLGSGPTVPAYEDKHKDDNVVHIAPLEKINRDHQHTISAITDKLDEIRKFKEDYTRDLSLKEAELDELQRNLATYKDMAVQKIKEIFPSVDETELTALLFAKAETNAFATAVEPPPIPDPFADAATEIEDIMRTVDHVE